MTALRTMTAAVLLIVIGVFPATADEKLTTYNVQSVDAKKKTITMKPAKKGAEPKVIEVTDDTKYGWLRAKDMKASLSDIKPNDMITVKEVDGKVTEVNNFRDPKR